MLNPRPRTVGTARLVRVDRFTPAGCDDRSTFYPTPASTVPSWEIHRDTCRCAYCI